MSPTFRSLRIFNYRVWAMGAIVSNTGTWMQRVAQDWLVLTQLTDDSGLAVGITTGLQFAPMLLLVGLTGLVADRFPRRRVLAVTQSSMALLGLGLGVLVLSGAAQLWHVYVFAGLLGVAAAFDGPARQTFVSEMVSRDDLSNAVGLNSASFHAARIGGPAAAGLLIAAVGTGWVFVINAFSFAGTLVALASMRAHELRPQKRAGRERGQVREGLRYVRGRPDLVMVLGVVGLVGTFGLNFQLTTGLMARLEYDLAADGYGLMTSVMAVGSLAGALLAARRERPTLRLVVGATAAFGVACLVAASMPTPTTFALALIPVGLSALTLMTSANATVQMSTAPEMRGRVMALYMAIFMGGTPLGSPLVGWVGEAVGARWSIVLGGVVALLTAAAATAWYARAAHLQVRYRLTRTPHLLVTPHAEWAERDEARRELAAREARDTASAA